MRRAGDKAALTLLVFKKSLASSTIRALQTTFCGVFRSRTSRSNRSRPVMLIAICSIFLIGTDSQLRADL